MSRIITRMTRGRIRSGAKKVLVLAVAGALYFGSGVTPTPTPAPQAVERNFGRSVKVNLFDKQDLAQAIREDEEILFIIKKYIETWQI